MTTKDEYLKQHHFQYLNVLKFVVDSNALNLYEQGVVSLFKKPPLDSMDLLKKQAINIAKNNELIIDVSKIDLIIDSFRSEMIDKTRDIYILRKNYFNSLIDRNELVNYKVIKFTRKQVKEIDKLLLNTFKKILLESIESILIDKVNVVFKDNDISKKLYNVYLRNKYMEAVLSQFESILAIRNNTLDNAINEQGHRYLFTKKNSHLFD